MKLLLAGLLAASTVAVAAPAVAQSVYIGPNGGVGVGIGGGRYGYDRGPRFEGRSAYRGDREFRRGGDRDFRRDRGDRY